MDFEKTKSAMESLIKDIKPQPLNKTIFSQANSYIKASNILENEIKKVFDQNIEVDDRIALVQSIILLRSFAIELLLKCLIIIDKDEAYNSHDLKKLNDITIPHKHDYISLLKSIKEEYVEIIISEYSKIDSKVKTKDDLFQIISSIGENVFTHWRYIFEKDISAFLNLSDLNSLGNAVYNAVIRIKK